MSFITTGVELLKKHKERATLVGLVFGFLFVVGGGIYLQKKKDDTPEALPEKKPKKLVIQIKNPDGNQGSQKVPSSEAFYLRPTADELLEQLSSLENLTESAINARFATLRLLWPVYFFSIEETEEGTLKLLSDVSEDGFGVMVQTEISSFDFPDLLEVEQGQKIWIGGELLAVDPAGTGVIHLKTEYITLKEDPLVPVSPESKKQ